MLPITYNQPGYFGEIPNFIIYLKNNAQLKETVKLKALYENAKTLLNIPSSGIKVGVATTGEKIYNYTFSVGGASKVCVGWMVYMPDAKRLDVYDATNPTLPIIQFTGRKIAFMNYSTFLGMLGIEQLFKKLTNIL